MIDDFDSLIDEVEAKYCSKRDDAESGRTDPKNSHRLKKDGRLDEIDDILDALEIDHDAQLSSRKPATDSRLVSNARPRSRKSEQARCFPLYLGGSQSIMGLSKTGCVRSCDRLRCTACDFKVLAVNDYEWHQCSDQLFFRNNVPDLNKLKENLVRKPGWRAYACQCCWRSICKLTTPSDSGLRWVCGKHSVDCL